MNLTIKVLYSVGIATSLLISGCTTTSDNNVKAPVITSDSNQSGRVKTGTVAQAIQLLQNGHEVKAKKLLTSLSKKNPDSHLIQDLLKQIQLSPQHYFKHKQTTSYQVKSGDTLSDIAKEYLNNEWAFYALAKLNGIVNARQLQIGQTLILPSDSTTPVQTSSEKSDEHIQQVQSLLDKGRYQQALLLNEQTKNKQLRDQLRKDIQLALAQYWLDSDRPDKALPLYQSILKVFPEHPQALKMLETLQTQQHNKQTVAQIERLYRQQASDSLQHLFMQQKSRLNDLLEDDSVSAAMNWVLEQKHGEAVSLYRQQELQQAIEIWSQLLQLSPQFEPAQVYIQRAKMLLKRLEKID